MDKKLSNNMQKKEKFHDLYFYGIFIIIIMVPTIFWSTTSTMVELWQKDSTYNHGFLIFPISLWLLYQSRPKVEQHKIQSEPRVLALILPVILIWLASSIIDVNVTEQLAMIALLPLTIWAIYGRDYFKVLLFPLGFLFFAVPMGKSLIPPLMNITAEITVNLVALSGVPIYQEGLHFILPSGNWSVIDACSGLNYLVASITLGLLYAYITYQKIYKQIIFVLFISLVAIIANGLRAYGIVMIGHFSSMKYGTGGDHTFYGWIFFGLVIFLVFYLANFWADQREQIAEIKNRTSNPKTSISSILSISILALLISAQSFALHISSGEQFTYKNIPLSLPDNFGAWQHRADMGFNWQPQIEGTDFINSETYTYGQDVVQINIGYYPWQSQGSEAVSYQNQVLPPEKEGWILEHSTDLQQNQFYVRENVITNHSGSLLIWQWYLIGDHPTPNANIAKLMNLINLVFDSRNDASIIFIATPILTDRKTSREILSDFLTDSASILHTKLSDFSTPK